MKKVFYSWQSDKKAYEYIIRTALHAAAEQVGDIKIETASSDAAGAIRIDNKIIEKIEKCDLYVADLSIVGNLGAKKRKSPNPNVIYETGYAHGFIGEGRLYLIANKEKYNTEKFPFDIRNRRLALYDFSDKKTPDILVRDLKTWMSNYQPVSPEVYLDVHAEVGSIGSNGSMIFYFTNEEDKPYYLETMHLNGKDVPIARYLKAGDNASIQFNIDEYPFDANLNDFSFLVSRRGSKYRIYQNISLEKRADDRFNLTRVIPKIEKVELAS